MNITIPDPRKLADAVAWAAHGTDPKPVIPYYAALHLEWDAGELTITGFDGDNRATARVDGTGDGDPAQVYVHAGRLAAICKALPGEPVKLRTVTPSDAPAVPVLHITAGPSKWRVRSMPWEVEPPQFTEAPELAGTADAAALQVALRVVLPALKTTEKVPEVFRHVLLTATGKPGDPIEAWGSNRYLVTRYECPWEPVPGTGPVSVLLPGKSLALIAAEAEGRVEIAVSDSLVGFAFGTRTLVSRRWAGEYPQMSRFLRQPAPVMTAEVDAPELAGALRRVGLCISGAAPQVICRFADGTVTLEGYDQDESEETLVAAVTWPNGAPEDGETVMVFNPGYLATVVAAAPGATVARFAVAGPQKPVLITDGDDKSAYRGVLVPIATAHVAARAAAA